MYARKQDRGENMAILHGVVRARAGDTVVIACDEEAGSRIISRQANVLTLEQMRGLHVPGGSIAHVDTLILLRWAIEAGAFSSLREFQKKYRAMVELDEALPREVKRTGLTKRPPWPV